MNGPCESYEECKAVFAIYQGFCSHIDGGPGRDGNSSKHCLRTTMTAARMVYRIFQDCFRTNRWCWDTVYGAAGGRSTAKQIGAEIARRP